MRTARRSIDTMRPTSEPPAQPSSAQLAIAMGSRCLAMTFSAEGSLAGLVAFFWNQHLMAWRMNHKSMKLYKMSLGLLTTRGRLGRNQQASRTDQARKRAESPGYAMLWEDL